MAEPDLSPLEMQRVHARDVFVKQALADRLAHTLLENLELMAIVDEMQRDLMALRDLPAPETTRE